MAAAPTSSFVTSMSNQPPRGMHALVNEETRAPLPVRLYPSQHRVSMTRYATSTDPRGYIPVFEYPLNGQYIMIDCETGMVHFTGIWKALGHTKADVVKLVESDPTIAPYLRKVRGGYLKIQGTWLPFETAQILARRVAWQVRFDLIPLFGPEFPDVSLQADILMPLPRTEFGVSSQTCLGPGEPGFGQLLLSAPKPRGRRGTKKTATASAAPSKDRVSVSSSQNNQSRPASYPSHDSMNARTSSHSLETPGVASGYGSSLSQSRYSPYARLPSHGITQLDPLSGMMQSTHNNANQAVASMYPNHYQQGARASTLPSNCQVPSQIRSSMNGDQISTGSTAPGIESGVMLPSMRNFQPHPAQTNFFETYRGPDSFEALGNKWLAPEATSSISLTDNGLLNGENVCWPPAQYSTGIMPPKSPVASSLNQYSFSNTLDSIPSGAPRGSDQPSQSHRPTGYTFDPHYEANYHQGLVRGNKGHKPSFSPDYSGSNLTAYDQTYGPDAHPATNPGSLSGNCYVPTQSSSSENPSGSPSSHCSHPPKSPTPSSASTSTHLHNSHNIHSNRSSSNTLGGISNLGGLNRRSEDLDHFSVLTSPAHLDAGGAADNSVSAIQKSESDWNSLNNSNSHSPPQQDS